MLGAYSYKPRERRFFGTLHIFMRILNLLAFTINFNTYFQTMCYIIIVVTVLVALFQPYKWHNITDIVLFLATLHCLLMWIFVQDRRIDYPHGNTILNHVYHGSISVAVTVISVYGMAAVLITILPKRCIQKFVSTRLMCWKNTRIQKRLLPYQMKYSEGEPLLNK